MNDVNKWLLGICAALIMAIGSWLLVEIKLARAEIKTLQETLNVMKIDAVLTADNTRDLYDKFDEFKADFKEAVP